MRTLLLAAMSLALMASVAMADPIAFDLATIQGMQPVWDAGGTTSTGETATNVGTAIRFAATMQSGDGTTDGWASMGWGYGWPAVLAAGLGDLTGYDSYELVFTNTNNSNWFVNLWMNTGWTDAPYNETNQFYQNGWVEIAPGVSTTVVLDLTTVANLNHVTGIGFQVGGNMIANYPYGNNPSNPDVYHINVAPVPVPGAVLLGFLGLGYAGMKLRKRV